MAATIAVVYGRITIDLKLDSDVITDYTTSSEPVSSGKRSPPCEAVPKKPRLPHDSPPHNIPVDIGRSHSQFREVLEVSCCLSEL